MAEFLECDACRKKLGSPLLCYSCRNNRETFFALRAAAGKAAAALEVIVDPDRVRTQTTAHAWANGIAALRALQDALRPSSEGDRRPARERLSARISELAKKANSASPFNLGYVTAIRDVVSLIEQLEGGGK